MAEEPRLYPDDQQRVDAFLKEGVNAVERKPFKPLRLLFILLLIVTGISIFSLFVASLAGL